MEYKKTGIGFGDFLALAFIILKLCGVIHWKWIWVLSPIWIMFIVAIIVMGVQICIIKSIIGR